VALALGGDLDQLLTDLAKGRDRHQGAVDPAAAAAAHRDLAREGDQLLDGDPLAEAELAHRRGHGVEDRGHGRALAAAGDHLAVDAAAEGETQAGDAERLARAGLAGEGGQPVAGRQGHRAEHGEIGDAELDEGHDGIL